MVSVSLQTSHLNIIKTAGRKRITVIPVIKKAEFAPYGRPLVLVRRSESVAAKSLVGPGFTGDSVVQFLVVFRPGKASVVLLGSFKK